MEKCYVTSNTARIREEEEEEIEKREEENTFGKAACMQLAPIQSRQNALLQIF